MLRRKTTPPKAVNKDRITPEERKLIRRYLIWCYKTTKEELDRIDRYFTQLLVDKLVLGILHQGDSLSFDEGYRKEIEDFKGYLQKKEERVFVQKFVDPEGKILQPRYRYLRNRLAALEKTIVSLLGEKQLTVIQDLYDVEMTRRIIEAREHT
jgi:hypothetical protein